MRILLANHQLSIRSGSELATFELARVLKARGHEVAVFTFFKGALAEALTRDYGIAVFDDTQADRIILFGADIVHTHHAPCAHFLRLYTMGAARIHAMLGVLTPLEAPPLDPDIFSAGLAVSEEVAERIAFTPFGERVPVEIFRNWFDDPGASTLAPPAPRTGPARIAVISNHIAPELSAALTELAAAGEAEAEYFGIETQSAVIDSAFLANYDLVISIGRTAILAAACGRACIMADIHGSDGLLTADALAGAARVNFSGRATRTPISASHLRAEIARARSADLESLRALVLADFSLDRRLDQLEQLYATALAQDRRRLDRGDWPAEGLAYAELAARVRHAEHMRALAESTQSSALSAMSAELDTLAASFAAQAEQIGALQREVEACRVMLSATPDTRQDLQVIDHLQRTLASRDEAIAWLQSELRLARGRPAQTPAVPRGLRAALRAHLATLAQRAPALRTIVRTLVPLPLRERLHRMLANSPEPAPAPARAPMLLSRAVETAARPSCFDVICYANIEWSARFQRPQQLMQQFARAGHRVFYVVASRRPADDAAFSAEPVADNIWQVALHAAAAPNHYADAMSCELRAGYADALAALMQAFTIRSAVQIVHLPFWRPLAHAMRDAHRWKITYDCMDEWDSFPNIGAPLLAEERTLVANCDLLTVTGRLLQEKWAPQRPDALLLRNGVDNAFFAAGLKPSAVLAGAPRPVIGFYGALAEWIDFDLIAGLADLAPGWTFVLVGDHFTPEVEKLQAKANIHMPGLRPYAEMPAYLHAFDACIIPFKLNKITHAVDPVKFYEFLAGGKPIVSTPLAELQPFADFVAFAETPDQFKHEIERLLEANSSDAIAARQAFAAANDWHVRFELYRDAIKRLHPLVSIVIVTFGNLDLTRLCIDSVLANTEHPHFEIIIVDNASGDGTPDYLRVLADQHDHVRIILNDSNRGFAAANNQGLALAAGDILVLLNNDTVVPAGWLSGLLARLDDDKIGLVGPVTNAVGNEAKVAPGYADLADLQRFADERRTRFAGKQFDIAMLAMFCVAMRRDVVEQVGPLDENFGIGMFEDDDYSMRVKAAGLRVVCAEDVYIHHFGQAAFKKLVENGEYDTLWRRNQAYYESKWGAWTPHAPRPG